MTIMSASDIIHTIKTVIKTPRATTNLYKVSKDSKTDTTITFFNEETGAITVQLQSDIKDVFAMHDDMTVFDLVYFEYKNSRLKSLSIAGQKLAFNEVDTIALNDFFDQMMKFSFGSEEREFGTGKVLLNNWLLFAESGFSQA